MHATDIARQLSLRRYQHCWRGRCPACNYPSTFVVRAARDGRAILFCASCQNKGAIADAIARAIGQPREPQPHRTDDATAAAARERKRARAMALWNGSESASGTLADLYLTKRGLPGLASSPALRFRGDCPHPEGVRLPALIALVRDAAGTPIAIHRTFLARYGLGKATVEPTKATLGSFWGGAVRLSEVTLGETLTVAEGLETAGSAARLLGHPSWAAVSAGNLAQGLRLPADFRDLIIAADADRAGQQAALAAAKRWNAEGRRVRVAMPNQPGRDFNDLLVQRATP